MSRPHLVHRGEQQRRLARNVGRLFRLAPLRIRRRDVVDRRHPVIVGTRNLDERRIGAIVRRRLGDQRLLVARDDTTLFLTRIP
jgi:hypothetical protein